MGEAETTQVAEQEPNIRPRFNRAVRIEARPDRLTADAGVMLMREVMERTGLIDWLEAHFDDSRKSDQVTYSMSELLRTQLALLAQGWTSAAAADHLREDPALRLSVSDRRQDMPLRAPSTPRTPDGLASRAAESGCPGRGRPALCAAVLSLAGRPTTVRSTDAGCGQSADRGTRPAGGLSL